MKVEILGRRKYKLLESIHVGGITVPQGFITDFASVPRVLWWLIPPIGKRYMHAAAAHDCIYRTPTMRLSRSYADNLFKEEMIRQAAQGWRVVSMYYMVRLFGWLSYKKRN